LAIHVDAIPALKQTVFPPLGWACPFQQNILATVEWKFN